MLATCSRLGGLDKSWLTHIRPHIFHIYLIQPSAGTLHLDMSNWRSASPELWSRYHGVNSQNQSIMFKLFWSLLDYFLLYNSVLVLLLKFIPKTGSHFKKATPYKQRMYQTETLFSAFLSLSANPIISMNYYFRPIFKIWKDNHPLKTLKFDVFLQFCHLKESYVRCFWSLIVFLSPNCSKFAVKCDLTSKISQTLQNLDFF